MEQKGVDHYQMDTNKAVDEETHEIRDLSKWLSERDQRRQIKQNFIETNYPRKSNNMYETDSSAFDTRKKEATSFAFENTIKKQPSEAMQQAELNTPMAKGKKTEQPSAFQKAG